MKSRDSSTSVGLIGDQGVSSRGGALSLLRGSQFRSRFRSWSWSRLCPVPNIPLKTFWSSQDWQLSVTSLSRRARAPRGRRRRRKILQNPKCGLLVPVLLVPLLCSTLSEDQCLVLGGQVYRLQKRHEKSMWPSGQM